MKQKEIAIPTESAHGMMGSIDWENLYSHREEVVSTGQIPLDAVIAKLQTTKTHRAEDIAKAIGVDVAPLKGAIFLLTGRCPPVWLQQVHLHDTRPREGIWSLYDRNP